MDDTERGRHEELLARMEERRAQADGFAWAVPGLAIAAQAFLLAIALGSDTAPLGRLLASLAGVIAVLATGHLMAKQVYNFDLYEAVIALERSDGVLDLFGVQTDDLRARLGCTPPPNTSYAKRRWTTEHLWRHRLVVRLKAVRVWGIALAALLVIDILLGAYSIWALVNDPGWL